MMKSTISHISAMVLTIAALTMGQGSPTKLGLYLHDGKKVVVK